LEESSSVHKIFNENICIEARSIIPALQRLRQEDLEFKVSLGCIVRPYLCKKKKKKEREKENI
jgi:hypothetical protein